MLRAAVRNAGSSADHERDGPTKHERDFGCLVGDLVHRPEGEVDEVQVDYRVHTSHSGTDTDRYHGSLRDRGIEHSARPNDVHQPFDLCPVAAAMNEIGTDHKDVGVRGHLFGHALCEPSRVCQFIGHVP